MDDIIYYDFAKEFTPNPGLRFRRLSDFSGEEFRESVLERIFKEKKKITINVEGVESSLGSSFLSEAFGTIAVKYGLETFNNTVKIDISTPKGRVTNTEMIERINEAIKKHKLSGKK
ncbi:STAS-like domain-containing protein [Aliarcobacter lanthieri]|uniref:STAS-like domain-containing protein n=1 Tax=Aliarcobacter lanthieri TaxID=1355374 RepID=UPI00047C8406|nr:STAS-like domain-containing protein [Aliarcobacter lanthieri]